MNRNYTLLTAVFLLAAVSLFGQNEMTRAIQSKLIETSKLSQSDVSEISVTRDFVSNRNGIRHIYGKQLLNGLPVVNSNYGATISNDGELVHVHHHFFSGIHHRNISTEPSLDAQTAIEIVVSSRIAGVSILESSESEFVISDNQNYNHNTKAKLGYFVNPEQELFLVWVFNVDMPSKEHWWNFFVDANSGEVLAKHDWQVTCHAGDGHHHNASCVESIQAEMVSEPMMPPPTTDGSSYRVFEFPIESPNHGERTLAVEPASEIASPFGWHDEDGEDGPEFAVTRGNNVHAYEDTDGENGNNPGNAVFGGGTLTFDFPFMAEEGPNSYQDAAVTNLFYASNRIHDILYIYGFDEAAGNFQETNYSGQGFGSDPVNAEAQDGGGTNNANMATPEDGFNPRMQMYLWNEPISFGIFVVNSPAPYAGDYLSSPAADFGAAIPEGGITADLALGFDDSGLDVNDLCEGAVNGNDLTNRIVLVRRGNCSFVQKAENAEAAGAAACIVINNEPGGVINMGGTGNLSIPAIMITLEDGNALIEALNNGETINASLNSSDGGGSAIRDGSFDNGIVVHEYVHGLTNRLVGGADEVGCLQNEEQMGEGWSDWYATMLTMDMTVNNPVYRPMGTFASGEPTNGNGIRPAPYDTSFSVNPYTYANVPDGNITVPHGVGFIWSTMLWDLTWALIDEHGFEDLEAGTNGGNIVAMNLVTEALFETACNPGFVDGRDAILLADELLYDGAHQCLIWKVFARRGLGFSADQGSSFSRVDGSAAFDLPTFCQEALVAPSADFEVDASNTCTGLVSFTDLSSDIPQSWLWDFGDGSTSDEQNPVHQYTEPGTYTVSLTVTNNVGEDVLIQEDLIVYEALEAPMAEDIEGCEGETVLFTATSGSGDVAWLDENDNVLQYGGDYELLLGANNESVYVQSIELAGPENVGPIDNDFGSGGNHSTEFIGTVVFETHGPATLVSAFVNSGGTGVRVINLYEGATTDNEPIATYPILVDFTGGDRIDLDIEIPQPGIYSIGLNNANMYRNDGGVSYPYESEDGLMDIIGSSAGEQYYYYFYDIEVIGGFCGSEAIEVHATVLPNAAFEFETNGLTATFNDASGSTSGWTWDFGDGNTSNEQNPTHTFAEEGTYSVSFTTDQGCTVTTEVEVFATNIEEASTAGILISPNPVQTELRISNLNIDQRIESIKVIDMQGRVIRAISVSSVETLSVDLSEVANGFYLLLLQNQYAETLYQQKISVVD